MVPCTCCPCCGYCDNGNGYDATITSNGTATIVFTRFDSAEEPAPLPERFWFPPPVSDRRPNAQLRAADRSGFLRPGRQLRHRGAFRNFHK